MSDGTGNLVAIGQGPEEGRPLVLLLHGYGADERDLVSLARAFPPGARWVSLRAPIALPQGGWAWFPIAGLPLAADAVLPGDEVRAATEAVLAWAEEHVPGGVPVVPLGFSQGGFMATQLLRTAPERFAGAIVLSGFAAPAPQPADALLRQRRPAVLFSYGEADPVIERAAFEQSERVLMELGDVRIMRRPGLGHGIDAAQSEAIRAFLDRI